MKCRLTALSSCVHVFQWHRCRLSAPGIHHAWSLHRVSNGEIPTSLTLSSLVTAHVSAGIQGLFDQQWRWWSKDRGQEEPKKLAKKQSIPKCNVSRQQTPTRIICRRGQTDIQRRPRSMEFTTFLFHNRINLNKTCVTTLWPCPVTIILEDQIL